jgi:D-aminopeptidase
MAELRWRDLAGERGLAGALPPGPRNAITDVPGLRVGQAQASSGERTGVTVLAPPLLPAAAGVATVNGTGELTAKLEIDERGLIETPVYLCGTHALGAVITAAVEAAGRGPDDVVIPVVAECDDGEMADSGTLSGDDVGAALANLQEGDVAEGSVGAGTGMSCFGFAGGIGTASRELGFGGHRLGVLLLCNFGEREYLDLLGTRLDPVPGTTPPASQGSCIAVCATDAPATPQQLRRLALRPLLGLARTGSYAAEGSGEIGLALSTTAAVSEGRPGPNADEAAGIAGTWPAGLSRRELDRCFAAAFEAAHEAVYNCLLAARPARRRDGTMQEPFPVETVHRLAGRR